jgi:L-alanine-DL-glutamate epimerase-like enolase superfamily enzyme
MCCRVPALTWVTSSSIAVMLATSILDWEHLWPLDAAKAIAQKHWDQQQRIGRLRKLIGGNARIEVDANSRMKVEFDV